MLRPISHHHVERPAGLLSAPRTVPGPDDLDANQGCQGLLHYRPNRQTLLLGSQAQNTLGTRQRDLPLDQLLDRIVPMDRNLVERVFADPQRMHDTDIQFGIRHPDGHRTLWLYFHGHRSGPLVIHGWCVRLES